MIADIHQHEVGRKCFNLLCTNRVGEGSFSTVIIPPVDNHGKGIAVIACNPCALELQSHTITTKER